MSLWEIKMKNVISKLSALALSFVLSSTVYAIEQANTNVNDINCTEFSGQLVDAVQNNALLESVSFLASNCTDLADQIVETAISLAPAIQHQEIMQVVANTGIISPTDILLAAIAGGGDPAVLSEPTAGGNLAIVPPSAASAPPIIGGRNGGSIASGN